ncbi:hypothetical protein AMS68_005812 [Peltaster fructicola]|uniref:HAUS augmin-like complex subunit 6 N-terminal domain-containing protein n=1 Tax=Peltaster fructicola TaxID=286661 RepID=A0A6H0Y057_9PEZI|nr:hypothetical protein AMS68_005812 [Peltaster fructicola]
MERPRSMIGAAGALHKRNASSIKSISRIQAPSAASERLQTTNKATALAIHSKEKETVQLFINNLKLLDLHVLPGWPAITIASFSNHDSKTRLRCSEWSLYQLFRLYDQHTTTDKLQPFFPPLEPLQSVNLRAALYRCLNELKKNGVLGREITLRKTMLDECSGEKFWELCLAFSGAVLRKVTVQTAQRHQPIAQRLASAQVLTKRERESLLPLAVAHKSALTRVLSQKHHRRQSYIHVFDSMREKEDELAERKHTMETQSSVVESPEHATELEMIEREISGNWTNDESFKDAIVNGDPAKPGDHMLLQSTNEFLAGIGRDEPLDTRRDSGVLEDIELQARAQNARVKEWQAMYAKLQIDKRSSVSSRASRETKKSVDLQFDQHHDLSIDDMQPEPVKSMTQPEPLPSYVSKYDEILTSMREELRRAQTVRRAAEAKQASPVRKPSITLDAIAGAPQLPHSRSVSRRSISPTFPLRPEMARRASSRTRSYQQPKVISQREFIPLKSEIFSPLKRTGSVSPASASGRSSLIASPIEEHSALAIDALVAERLSTSESQNSVVDSGMGLGLDLTESPVEAGKVVDEFKKPSLPSRSVSFAHRKSLSERTRLSMSFTRMEDNPVESSSLTQANESSPQSEAAQALAARTRQSMASVGMPLPVRVSPSFSHSRASSVAHPLVPAKQRTIVRQTSRSFSDASTIESTLAEEAKQRNITPREKLFDADAEYNSIFKSRPKIASSPPLSPVRGDVP